ncbi:MAG: NADH-quinone oxidoreductase subunit N [Methanomassiliicoccaceae archaeon]|nr:NADH-quinone oxidoreductase subunit N [Methanomassiliicoccaceae archaeon]
MSFFDTGPLEAIAPILPQIILMAMAILVPAIGFVNRKASSIFTLAGGAFALLITGWMMSDGYTGVFFGIFEFNQFTGLMTLIFIAVLCIVTMMSFAGSETRKHHGEYFSLLLIATIGMIFVAGATDLIAIFVGIELASISSYALVAFRKNDPRSPEAAVKYLIIGGISTAFSLFGMSLVYGLSGTTNIDAVAQYLASADVTLPFIVAVMAMIAGFGFKVAVVPFHAWAPDVYEGAPTPITAFLATGSKKMGFVVFIKIFLLMFIYAQAFGSIHELQWVFAIIAAITMTLGNVVAISQTNIKRMLAYSSIAQAGYIMIVLAVASDYALVGGLFHMITHVFMKGGAFIIVGALCIRGLSENISDYKGLAKRAPIVAFAMMLFLFSLAGIPPLAGFTSKFVLFSSAVTPAGTWIWLAAVAVINSAISLFYYARVVKAMYIDKGTTNEKITIPGIYMAAMMICAAFVIVLGVFPGPVLELCEAAASALLP